MSEQFTRYCTPGMKGLRAESIDDAAFLFADRRARNELGQRGHCRSCVHGAIGRNGSFAEFCAVIERSSRGLDEAIERNLRFIVYREEALVEFLESLVIDEAGNLRIK